MTDTDRIAALAAQIPGSQHLELEIAGSLRWPELVATPPDFGLDVRSLAEAIQRYERLAKFAAGLTQEQRDAVWSDPSAEAAELRRVMR